MAKGTTTAGNSDPWLLWIVMAALVDVVGPVLSTPTALHEASDRVPRVLAPHSR
jgi:hypothetical protein